jgi:monofunctional biosynthetic peptidoglycan transglycosylase
MTKAKKSGPGRRWIKWLFLGPIGLVLLVQLYFFVQVCWFVHFNPGMTSMMSAQLDVLRETNPKARLEQQWVPYSQISNQPEAGRDRLRGRQLQPSTTGWTGKRCKKHTKANTRRHKVVGGGSTITQQLAKNLFLSGSRSYLRKGQEMASPSCSKP